MTSKDFELIARVIKDGKEALGFFLHSSLAYRMADELKATNKQFNRDKFIRACGGEP